MNPYYRLILSLTVLTACQPVPTIERLDGSSVSEEHLSEEITGLMDAAGVTGLSVTVFNDNRVIYQRAFGLADAAAGDTLQTDQVFSGASLSKAVFGYLVADLSLDGIIDLDTPLQEYLDRPLPDIPFDKDWQGYQNLADDARYRQITARMCLSHTTGFPNWRWFSWGGVFEDDGQLRIYYEPGTRYSYSGEGFFLLQYVVEQVTGRGLEELARERVFDPLGMDMTSYVWQERFEGRFCLGHTELGKAISKDRKDRANAAGSLQTTPADYARFLTHILRLAEEGSALPRLLFEPNIRIRSRAQFGPLAEEQSTEYDDIELSYGLGWGLLQTPHGKGVFKEGHDEGFQHYSILFPERDMGILILSNSDNAESIFKELLAFTLMDIYTPWRWENYVPYDWEG